MDRLPFTPMTTTPTPADAVSVPQDKLAPPVHSFGTLKAPAPVQRQPKVFVALCTRDWQTEAHTSESVRAIGRACNCEVVVRYQMNDGVARSRNNLAASFLESDCDVLFFLDNDIIIEPSHFDRIALAPFRHVATPVTLEDTLASASPVAPTGPAPGRRGIVCALYPKKQPSLDWVVNWLPGEQADADGYIKVKHAGTGAMAISREALEDFIRRTPGIKYAGDPSPDAVRWDLFPMHATGPDSPSTQVERILNILSKGAGDGVVDAIKQALKPTGEAGRYDSEDWYFCNKMRAAGWDVWVDTKSQLRHVGKIVYPLQFTLTDEEVVDLVEQRYHIYPDHIRTFFASGKRMPGLMGGHRQASVRHWPKEFPVDDLHQADVLGGCYDVPYYVQEGRTFGVLDIGANVGAFARWAAKRWEKCPVHCYEADDVLAGCLDVTCDRIRDSFGHRPTVVRSAVRAKDVPALPPARVVKIDAMGAERELVEAIVAIGRADEFDAILVKYYDELTAYFIETLLAQTHFKHNHQRFDRENVGVVKFLRRQPRQEAVVAPPIDHIVAP